MKTKDYCRTVATLLTAALLSAAANATTLVQPVEMTAAEQLMLELLNRARANPSAEAARFGIDLNKDLPAGTITTTPKQPLAGHALLRQAARGHSQWMLDADQFQHTGSGGSTEEQRIRATGYPLTVPWGIGETLSWKADFTPVDLNVFAVPLHEQLFKSKDHRKIICHPPFDEVGVGLLAGLFNTGGTNWNAAMVTQKFGYTGGTLGPLVTGVAYHDLNANGFYDVGEGIQGVTVSVSGSNYHAITAAAGGYAVPIPVGNATRTVTFSGTGPAVQKTVVITGTVNNITPNHKVDFTPVYQPPVLAGSATPVAGLSNRYTISPDPFATARQVHVEQWLPAAVDAASNLNRVTTATSAGYSALPITFYYSGPASYHLAHIDQLNQFLTYKADYEVAANAQISMRSLLGAASPNQTAKVEVSTDGGLSWTAVYTQVGTNSWGETVFNQRVIPLASFAGRRVKLRLGFVVNGPYIPGAADYYGWYIDDLTFTNIREVAPLAVQTIAGNADLYFRPPAQGPYRLLPKTVHYDQIRASGPVLEVTAGPETATLATWAAKQEDANSLPPGALLSNLGGDYQGKGVPLVIARALGLNPVTTTAAALPKMVPNGAFLDFNYWRDLTATEVLLVPEISINASNFSVAGSGSAPVASSDSVTSTVGNIQHRRLRISKAAAPKAFVRLKGTAN